jgi:hypothetical protein
MEIIEWKFIYILLDLPQNSCEKYNFRSLAGIKPQHVALQFWSGAPTKVHMQATFVMFYIMGKY